MDIFDGQPLAALDFTTFIIEESLPLFQGQTRTELGMGNQLLLPPDKLLKNVRAVQERNDIEFAENRHCHIEAEIKDKDSNRVWE